MRYALKVICILALCTPIRAQCTFDVQVTIADLATLIVPIQVEGLTNDDLSGSQALCAVGLHFRHNYLGDLTIELISPSGQVVMLVGQVTDLISPTNLTAWDVQFLQCGFPAAPDGGFSAQWDNNQAWGILTTYTGSYYPASGCLEDFNIGSANGIWQLRIIDHDAPQSGVLLGVTLVFCDNSGITCTVCAADAGQFIPAMERICAGDDIPVAIAYPDSVPDPALYGAGFLWSEDGNSYQFAGQISTATLPAGTYTICGLSFSRADSLELFAVLSPLTFAEVRDTFDTGNIGLCADLTGMCLSLRVDPPVDTTYLQREVCVGEGVTIGDQTITTPGRHIVTVQSSGACDSIVVLDLEVIVVEARIVQSDTITCTDRIVMLDGTSSITGPLATYSWTTSNGMILGPSNGPVVTIDGGGAYTLTISDRGCTNSLTIKTLTDGSVPLLAVSPGVITCNQPTFTFMPVVFPLNVQFQWQGPSGFSSTIPQPVVSVPGTYMLTITDSGGCSSSVNVQVAADTQVVATLELLGVDCMGQTATLRAQQGLPGFTFLWTTPIGAFTTQEITATISGQYCVEVTGTNGCTGTTCVDYLADYAIPDVVVSASSDTLYCSSVVELTGMTSVTGASVGWFATGALISTTATHTVNTAGTYVFQVTAPNQCRASDTVTVFASPDLLPVTTFSETVSCRHDTALIGIIVPDPFATVVWAGPGLVDTNSFAIRVTAPGVYKAEITSGQDCVQFVEVPVPGDFATVPFLPVLDTITCTNPIAALSFVPLGTYTIIEWLLPDATVSSDSVLVTSLPGNYQLSLTGANGCRRTEEIHLLADTIPPSVFISSDVLGCTDSVEIQLVTLDDIDDVLWSGPGGFMSTQTMPVVTMPGTYTLMATGQNGCVAVRPLQVVRNAVLPELMITGDSLDCIDSVAVLQASSPDTDVTFAWFYGGLPIADTSEIIISTPGEYIVSGSSADGCVAFDTIIVDPPVIPGLSAFTDTVTCVEHAMLMATSDHAMTTFAWLDAGGNTGTGPLFTTAQSGPAIITVAGPNGCTRDTTLIVGIDTIAPVALAIAQGMITCTAHVIDLDGSMSVGGSLSFLWTTPDGMIDGGDDTATPTISGAGTYLLHVTDGINGCTDIDTVVVVRVTDGPLGDLHVSMIPECETNSNGILFIDSLPGAQYPLTISVNGMLIGIVEMITGLQAGTYTIEAVDSFGCQSDTTVFLTQTSSSTTLTLGDDQVITLGDTAYLEVTIDLDPSQIVSVQWTGSVPCDTCLANAVAPLQSGIYGVLVQDIFGCVTSDSVLVIVDERPTFFVPNAFSPNNDGINDFLMIAVHPGIERIVRFSIFDRWGNVVFYATDFGRLDTGVRWDGTYQGRKLDPAVFVYLVELRLLTGRSELRTGTVTLVK